ncbi:hypothetical protein B0H13DRAFT_1879956 [Mycena leptocephala]|nr:hypothetical protein B0H13DRAFT_1879956 [Mycena leptocephala]
MQTNAEYTRMSSANFALRFTSMPNIILKSGGKEVSNRRIKGGNVVAPWRQQQKSIAPKEGDEVAAQADASPVVPLQYEVLYLPSDLTTSKRLELHVVILGREGRASIVLNFGTGTLLWKLASREWADSGSPGNSGCMNDEVTVTTGIENGLSHG